MTILDEFRRDEQRVLDRLVDGELGVHERRELLAGLDDEPGAWRRCALAFLESQSWRWQMARMAGEPILAQLSTPRLEHAAKRRFGWSAFFAVAASLAVAFAVGTRFPTLEPAPRIAESTPDAPAGAETHTVARPDSQPAIETVDRSPVPPWETLTLAPVEGSAAAEPIELRVVSDDAEGPLVSRTGLSQSLAGRLQQDGWEVDRRRQLLPIELSDGRRLVVPIEEIDLRRPEVFQF